MKTKRFLIALLCSMVFFSSVNVYAQEQETIPEETKIINEFNQLQQDIDNTLIIENEKYIFDADKIESVINTSNFDFEELQRVTGINYTKSSFFEAVMYQIQNTVPSITYEKSTVCEVTPYGTYCGRNAVEHGWNYERKFSDKANSTRDANIWLDLYEQNMNKYHFDDIRNIQAVLPAWASILVGIGSSGAALETVFALNMGSTIRKYNTGRCGTVIDVNKFHLGITGWSQDTFAQ